MSYVTINSFAEKTGLSPYFVRQLVKDNKIPHIQSGKKYYIDYERAEDALHKLQTGGAD